VKNKTSIRLILIMSFVLIALFSLGCKKNSNDDKGIEDPVTNTSDLDDIDLDEEKKDSNIVDTKDTNDDIGKTDENDDKKDIKEENLLPAIHYGDVQIETEIILSEDFETGKQPLREEELRQQSLLVIRPIQILIHFLLAVEPHIGMAP